MIVHVRLFAAARELAGREVVEILAEEPLTVGDLRALLATQVPALAPLLPHVRLAVNSSYASDATHVAEGDDVACIPPVSGG